MIDELYDISEKFLENIDEVQQIADILPDIEEFDDEDEET